MFRSGLKRVQRLSILEKQMGNDCDDRQCNNGSLQEDDEQILQRDRDLTSHNDAADFGHIDQLCHAGCCHDEAGKLTFNRTCNHAGHN